MGLQTTAASDTQQRVETVLAGHFRRLARNRWIFAVAFALAAAAAFVASRSANEDSDARGSMALGGLCLLGAVPMAWLALTDERNNKAARVLRERRQEIVWVYRRVGRGDSMVICLANGEAYALASAGEAVMDALAPTLRHATMGYRPEIAAAWRARPASLARTA